jgi:hypothetical protein
MVTFQNDYLLVAIVVGIHVKHKGLLYFVILPDEWECKVIDELGGYGV